MTDEMMRRSLQSPMIRSSACQQWRTDLPGHAGARAGPRQLHHAKGHDPVAAQQRPGPHRHRAVRRSALLSYAGEKIKRICRSMAYASESIESSSLSSPPTASCEPVLRSCRQPEFLVVFEGFHRGACSLRAADIWPKSVLSGPIFSGPVDFGLFGVELSSVVFIQHFSRRQDGIQDTNFGWQETLKSKRSSRWRGGGPADAPGELWRPTAAEGRSAAADRVGSMSERTPMSNAPPPPRAEPLD